MLKILGRKDSVNVMKVLWACEELDLPFERVDVGGAFEFQNAPDYLRLNPNGRVPSIDDHGFVLWESNVIVRYLDDHLGQHPFVAGSEFTMADIPLGCMAYRWYALPGVDRPVVRHMDRWWQRLRERPGYQKHLTLPLT